MGQESGLTRDSGARGWRALGRSLICLFSLCRWFQGPTTASAAEGFAIVSVALTLVGFWVINFRTDNEFLQAYMICSGSGRRETLLEAPYLVSKGVYFDSTPCMDIDSVSAHASLLSNPQSHKPFTRCARSLHPLVSRFSEAQARCSIRASSSSIMAKPPSRRRPIASLGQF